MLNEPTPKVSPEPDATGWKDKEATTAARIDDLLAIDGPDVRQHAIYEFLRDLSFDDLLEIFTSREQLPSGPRAERLLKTVWRRLGELDGERALHQLMLVVSSRKERRDLPRHTEAAVASWAFAAPVEALFYLNEGLEGNDPFARNHITTWQRSLMAEGRYEVVSRLIPEIRTDLHRIQAIRMLVSEWIKFDPDRVGEWLNELPDGNARSDGLEIYVRNWAKSDPGSAAEWAQNLDLDERERFMSVVAGQWVGSGDQMEFVDWLAAQPRSPNRDQLIYDLGLRLGAELGQSLAPEYLRSRVSTRVRAEAFPKDHRQQPAADRFRGSTTHAG